MATDQGKTRFPLKLLVDEKRNQVVVAEAGKDFMDILFSFLTLPMGTIMRLAGNQKFAENGLMFGMYHLYQSVKDFGDDNFSTKLCKSFLLKPRNPLEKYCMNLKVQIDDSRFNNCYVCNCTWCGRTTFLDNVACRCSHASYSERSFSSFQHKIECNDVFLKGGTMFIVSDDLQEVMPCSPTSLIQRLSNLGIDDMTQVKEISVEAGIEEISSLLKYSLFSKSPLTDVFLVKQGKSKNPVMPESRSNLPLPGSEAQKGTSTSQLSLKLVLRKSTNTILFAEASGDFVNFLFSFLTIPIGTVVELLKGQTGLECIDNLRKSVENLEPEWLCVDKNTLLNAGVAKEYDYWKHPLGIETLQEWTINQMGLSVGKLITGRFMKTPSKFLVTDDLSLINLSSTSSMGFIKGLNVPFHDIEERMVTVGQTQALGILKASLTSSSALTNGLNSVLMKPKQEP